MKSQTLSQDDSEACCYTLELSVFSSLADPFLSCVFSIPPIIVYHLGGIFEAPGSAVFGDNYILCFENIRKQLRRRTKWFRRPL